MGDLARKIKAKLKRRTSSTPPPASTASSIKSTGRSRSLKSHRPPSIDAQSTSRSKKTDTSSDDAVPPMTPDQEPARQPSPLSAVESKDDPPTLDGVATPHPDPCENSVAADQSLDEEKHKSPEPPKHQDNSRVAEGDDPSTQPQPAATLLPKLHVVVGKPAGAGDKMGKDQQSAVLPSINEDPHDSSTSTDSFHTTTDEDEVTVQTPSQIIDQSGSGEPTPRANPGPGLSSTARFSQPPTNSINPTTPSPIASRRPHSNIPTASQPQGAAPAISAQILRTLLGSTSADDLQNLGLGQLPALGAPRMGGRRKIWVRRPGASATLITISEDDVVDDVRDQILRKYANSLGRQFDSPDLTLRIVPRENQRERPLGPDEHMCKTIDAYFPGGQTVDDALIIDVPLRRTPRSSPRTGPPHAPQITSVFYAPAADDAHRPAEAGTDYFGPAVVPPAASHVPNGTSAQPHSIGVLTSGQLPQIPSPGGTRRANAYMARPERPRLGRQHTSSPTIMNLVSAGHAPQIQANAVLDSAAAVPPPPTAPPIPTPPPVEPATIPHVATPPALAPPRVASPRPAPRPRKKKPVDGLNLPPGILSGGVPPINVLIVEDNPINLRLLEVFVKRLKVRWQTAVNGREAVDKWRQGGFHLVLMDIQLPVMSGLEATREIRRLERVNSIGVFSSSASSAPDEVIGEPSEEDKLINTDMFKSPVIIVALTASSLQSDRHEALAAGCNDFLTKPVNFVWFEKKIMEWGCMQALIDFDGWRKWKDFSQKGDELDAAKKAAAATAKAKVKKSRSLLPASSVSTTTAVA